MKKERFFELLTNTDDDLLLAAEQTDTKRKKPFLLRIATAAAGFGILLIAAVAIIHQVNQPTAYTYSCYEIAGLDCDDGGSHADEHPLLNSKLMNYHGDPTAPETATVFFNGSTYTGAYRYSYVSDSRMYLVHKYKADEAYFEINAQTGELCAWSAIVSERPAATIPAEQCRPIADQIASSFLNTNEYKVRERIIENGDNYYCKFTYYKELDGLPTSDSVIISIDGNGNLTSLRVLNLGSAKLANAQTIDRNAAREFVNAKLDAIYSDSNINVSHTISLSNVTILDNGDIGLIFSVENEFVEQDEIRHSAVQILVIQSTNE